jgi:hypothetical protein
MRSVIFSKAGFPTFVALGEGGIVPAQGPERQRVSGGPILQAESFLRADAGKLFSRGNVTYSNTFSVWRTFATPGAAEDFLNTHPGDLPTTPEMVCEITLNDGSRLYLTTPFITIQDSSINGVTVSTTYQLRGGRLVGTNPYT